MIRRYFALTSFCLLVSGAALASLAYNPDHLAQFKTTNQCHDCDLSGAFLYGNHSGAVLANTNLTGARGLGTFSQTNFSGSNLSSGNWSHANLSYAQLAYIPLVKVNFSGANLSYASFSGSNTNDANFAGANLLGSNITQDQLDAAASYCNATLPDGTKKHC